MARSKRRPNLPSAGHCPCGSEQTFGDCCNPILGGSQQAQTAEALMRSRFSAFATRNERHLLRSWFPDARPAGVSFDSDQTWMRLKVVDTQGGGVLDTTGFVEFVAHSETSAGPGSFAERSRFVRSDGDWVHVDGVAR